MKKKKLYTATYTFEGKRYYVRSSVSQRDADKRAAKALAAREEGLVILTENMPVGEYALKWAETYKKTTVSETVYKSYVARIKNHIIPAVGAMKLKDVKPTNLQEVMNAQAGKSKTHCDKLLVTLRGIFGQAVKDELIRRDPSEDIKAPQAHDGTHRSITDEERARTLHTAETHRFGLAVKIMLLCGLRPQEAIALQWSDIDQINHRLMVRRAVKKDGYIAETKSAAGNRDIPIPPMLWDSLHIPNNINQFILLNTRGERHTATSLRRAWRSFQHEAGVTYELYCLRHTYCTDLESVGVPINVAKYLMGHSSIAVTSRIYTHMREDTLSAAADKIAAIGATAGATPKAQKGVKSVQNINDEDEPRTLKTGTK